MKLQQRCKGVVALMLTPFLSDGNIDWHGYDAYIDYQLSMNPAGLFAVCGSSEMQCLTPAERRQLAKRTVQRASGKPVLATANLGDTLAAQLTELKQMADTGIDGIVLVGANPDTAIRSLADYYVELIAAAPCPVMLYEWPQARQRYISSQLLSTLADSGRVAGIKDTTCTIAGIKEKLIAAAQINIYQANTPFLLESIRLGVAGAMTITSTICTGLNVALWDTAAQTPDAADELHTKLVFLDSLLRFGYPATAKYLLNRMGLPFGATCRTSVALHPEACKALDIWLRKEYDLCNGSAK